MPLPKTYLIVGGGVAGTTAAETIRKTDPDGRIIIVSDEPHRFYSRIMISKPNFFLGKLPFDQIWLKTEAWYAENNIDLITGRKAVRLDPREKIVELDDGTQLRYGKLLLATGGSARAWNVSGTNKRGVFYLRTLGDAKTIMEAVKTATHGVAIGGGFISFEMCEMLRLAGIDVTLLLREQYYWSPLLDESSGRMIEEVLERGGVKILRNTEATEVNGAKSAEAVVLKSGERIPCNMVIVGIGIVYLLEWIKNAGVAVERGVVVNEYLETNISDVYAAGDMAEYNDLILEEHVQLGNWVNAQMQGKVAGLNMGGQHETFRLVSFYTTQGFGITIAFVGDVRPLPDREVVSRGSPAGGSYARILIKNEEVVGATLINRTQDLGAFAKLIERNVKVAAHKAVLTDPSTNLQSLLV